MPQDEARSPGTSAPGALRCQAVQAMGLGETRIEVAATLGITRQAFNNRLRAQHAG